MGRNEDLGRNTSKGKGEKIMKKYIIVILLLLLYPNHSLAYDDALSHPKITEESIRKLGIDIDNYLRNNLGLKDGFNTKLGIMGGGWFIADWLQQG
ncbi:hypothetical protein GTO10_01025, partial [Candidatus Saccharibacteria bacterium]|nr:hypothetical protein [Candidatus Saccharibacteria bacterium]